MVGVVDGVVVVVGVVVGVVDCDVVPVVVVVGVDVAVVVVVSVVVGVDVGVVISQSWKLVPSMYAVVIAFSVSATASQSSLLAYSPAPIHLTSAASPSGPRYSETALLTASAASAQLPVSGSSPTAFWNTPLTPRESPHCITPVRSVGHTSSTVLRTSACHSQLVFELLAPVRRPMSPVMEHSTPP